MRARKLPWFTVAALLFALVGPIAAEPAGSWIPEFASPANIANLGAITRPFGVAPGDFDKDGALDFVIGRVTGNIHFARGNGDGTFPAATVFPWKLAYFNAWAFATGDVNRDGNLDVIWGANDNSPPTAPYSVNDGEVRALLGNGDGTFAQNPYYVSGVLHNAGALLADIGSDAGSLAAGDVDGDGDVDVVAGAVNGANTTVKLLRHGGAMSFTPETILSEATACTAATCTQIYYPAIGTQDSPWGLALGDVDADGDLDLWVGDRALYVYLYLNNGAGIFTLKPPTTPPLPTRPNVLLAHDAYRYQVGYTPSLGSADLNGDGKADLVLGLQSGAQATPLAHDGELLARVSTAAAYDYGAATLLSDIGWMARGVNVLDVNGDDLRDVVAAEYDGTVKFLRQVLPLDADGDGIPTELDNAPYIANAPRLDMNTDGAKTAADQLDNEFDTLLGDPANPGTWRRLGDPADDDDDNDGDPDAADNCPFVANADQADGDADGRGDACDPLENRDTDGDGIPDGPLPGDPYYAQALAAAIRWSQGTTHFVIRIDSLGRWWQNEFTQILTDAAILSPIDWATKCWENYEPADFSPSYEPCGTGAGTSGQTLTLSGGKQVPVSLLVVPKQLWTDPPVVTWINDRNNYAELEIAQHGAYHFNNTPNGDWTGLPDRNDIPCETCGLTEAENFELLRVGYNTLTGNYADKWVAESGATLASPKINWSTSANPLISYAPPYNASDTLSRQATAQLGYKSFSAGRYEEASVIFSPEGSHMEQLDQFGMFHASEDLQLLPPETPGDVYQEGPYLSYLSSKTQPGGLTTWLIEEVDWSGRPNNTAPRTADNPVNNTVYLPRWQAWMTLLGYVKDYPGGVAMTLGGVALAKAFDNAPTVPNGDQADTDHDGLGNVIDGATLDAFDVSTHPGATGLLSAKLVGGGGQPVQGQRVTFLFDADGNSTDETYTGTTGVDGVATTFVTPTRSSGAAAYSAGWDGLRATSGDTAVVQVLDVTGLQGAITAEGVALTWSYAGTDADHYEVWRADNAPYFTPGDICLAPGCNTTTTPAHTDAASCSDPAVNCTYVVRVVTTDHWRSPDGARLGVFNFALAPRGVRSAARKGGGRSSGSGVPGDGSSRVPAARADERIQEDRAPAGQY